MLGHSGSDMFPPSLSWLDDGDGWLEDMIESNNSDEWSTSEEDSDSDT